MAAITKRHDIEEGLYVFQQANSSRWYARFKLDGVWYCKTTAEQTLSKAIVKATKLQTEYQIMLSNNIPVHKSHRSKKHTFEAIAELAIDRMQDALDNDMGQVIFETYIRTLRKYHIPFFGKMSIRNTVDPQKLLEFDTWRTKLLGRVPAKSSVSTYNTAMQRVYDEALILKYITPSEIPTLQNTGRRGERRAAFTKDEYRQVLAEAKGWIKEGRKQVTRDIREQLYFYIQMAALTGMRPGTELEHLTWDDLHINESKDKKLNLTITVRKGKTTQYTGTRQLVCKKGLLLVVEKMILKYRKNYTDKIFSNTGEFGRNFKLLLTNLNMKTGAHGERVLYSLRHSYITWELEKGTNLSKIAAQTGTSVEMIERHYSHIVPLMFADELSS